MKILVTGSSGFIGFHATLKYLSKGNTVLGVDDENDYYDQNLKRDRRRILQKNTNFSFIKLDLSKKNEVNDHFTNFDPDLIIHLAAQAGVRHSLDYPDHYVTKNIDATLNILEFARNSLNLKHTVIASTSSVYGANVESPFSEKHGVDHPLQFYAVTKRSCELMAHSYSNLFDLPITILRFFTVYGPWGRPDMALFLFTKNIIEQRPIKVFNNGNHKRDFTYVDDIVDGIYLSSKLDVNDYPDASFNAKNPARSYSKFRIFNIGAGKPESLEDFISEIEKNVGKKSTKIYEPIQPGDVEATHADISELSNATGYNPKINMKEGVRNFVNWYREYYDC